MFSKCCWMNILTQIFCLSSETTLLENLCVQELGGGWMVGDSGKLKMKSQGQQKVHY